MRTFYCLVASVIICFSCRQNQKLIPIRIGWQLPLATQGQVTEVLKRTNILEQQGLDGQFTGFSYGGPQVEAALAGNLDVIFVGDQPAVNLISKGAKWKIVCRLFYTRTAIMVPLKSDVNKMVDFKGKTLASPFGSVAHREATLKERAAGLDPDKDVANLNTDILEISTMVQKGGEKVWGKMDGVAVWEPSTSLFELNNLARIVDTTRTLGIVAISQDFIDKHPEQVKQFLVALTKSWSYFAINQDKVNQWYVDDAKLSYSIEVLKKATSIEPNINAKTIKDIDLSLSQMNTQTIQSAAEWSFERKFVKSKTNMLPAIDQSFLQKANEIIQKEGFDIDKIKVKN